MERLCILQSGRDCNTAEEWVRVQLPVEELLKGNGVLRGHGVMTGVKATYNALRKHYLWKGMKEQIQTYVKHCQKCQQSKVSNQKTSGSLIPLPTSSGPWVDFTEMPESLGYNYILVVVDQFSKEVVFVPCTKEETTYSTAELFRDHVWCQHGLPDSVVSDQESVSASNFLGELYKLLGIKRKMSTAFHPQTDGQTEWLNQEINQYLCTYVNDHQNEWAKWIKIAQFVWNNTIYQMAIDYLPVQASSVPCEHFFSSGRETLTKNCNRISPILMEALQMMKFFLKKECLNFMCGWVKAQQEMLSETVDDDLLAVIIDANVVNESLSHVMDDIIGAIADDEGDEFDNEPELFD